MTALSRSNASLRIAVVGGAGFVGQAVVRELTALDHDVFAVSAPRLHAERIDEVSLIAQALRSEHIDLMSRRFDRADVVISAAGIATATSGGDSDLFGANSLLPRVLREAAVLSGAQRFVHVSSASVQGRRDPLDESWGLEPFSRYTLSKALGELVLLDCNETVIFRPTSVHGADRSVTSSLAKVARSGLGFVAGDGSRPTPQVLIENVASAISYTATFDGSPPPVVLQPWEGLTVRDLLCILGGSEPRRVPMKLVSSGVQALGSSRSAKVSANVRRVEMMSIGQSQRPGWLSHSSWSRPVGREGWVALAQQLRDD